MVDTCLPTVAQAAAKLDALIEAAPKGPDGQPLEPIPGPTGVGVLPPSIPPLLIKVAQCADELLESVVNLKEPDIELDRRARNIQTVVQQLANNIGTEVQCDLVADLQNQAIACGEQADLLLVVGIGGTQPVKDKLTECILPTIEGISNVTGCPIEVITPLTTVETDPTNPFVSQSYPAPPFPDEITKSDVFSENSPTPIIDRAIAEVSLCTDCVSLNAITTSNLEAVADLVEDISENIGTLAGQPSAGGCDPLPLGLIIPYGAVPSVEVPKCYLPCDGASYSKTGTYKDLFKVIGTTFGGDGSTFKVPDMRSRFPLGVSNDSVKEDHDATDTLVTDSAAGTLGGKGGREKRDATTDTTDRFTSTVIGNLHSDQSDGARPDVFETKTLPPYLALHYVIKARK